MRNGKNKYVLMKKNRACGNRKNNSDQNIYASMACMSGNNRCHGGNFGDSSVFTY